jgi:hypothetical protein
MTREQMQAAMGRQVRSAIDAARTFIVVTMSCFFAMSASSSMSAWARP